MSEQEQMAGAAQADEARELWELVQLAENEGLVREPMELRRYFAEQEHRLDAASLRSLAAIANGAGLAHASAWCSRETARAAMQPRFIERLRNLFEPKSDIARMAAEEHGVPVIELPLAHFDDDEKKPGRGR